MDKIQLSSLIRDQKYLDIINLVRDKKVSLWEKVVYNYLIKVLVYNNNPAIIKILIEEFPHDLAKDMDGRMPFHVIYEHGNDELIKRYIANNPSYIEAVNLKENTNFINSIISLGDTNMLSFALKVNPGININRYTMTLGCPLLGSIRVSRVAINNNDPNGLAMPTLLLKNGADPNILRPVSCFQYIAKYINNCMALIKLLVAYGGNINVPSVPTIFMLSHGSSNNHLLTYLQDSNSGYIFTIWDIIYCIKNKVSNTKLVSSLLYKIDQSDIHSYRDSNMNSILMLAVTEDADPEVISHLLLVVDVNSHNYAGETPIHLLFKNKEYKNYTKILETLFIDIFKKCAKNKTPLDYINDKEVPDIIDMFIKGYTNFHKLNNLEIDLDCIKNIKKNIFDSKKCNPTLNIPSIIEYNESHSPSKDFVLGIMQPMNTIDILIFYHRLLLQFPDLICTLSTDPNILDIKKNMIIQESSGHYINGYILEDFITEPYGILYSIYLPSIVIFRKSFLEFIHPSFEFYLNKAIKKNTRYIIVHAFTGKDNFYQENVLYDKVKNKLEIYRVDSLPYGNSVKFTKYIKDLFEKILNKEIEIVLSNVRIYDTLHKISKITSVNIQNLTGMINSWFIEQRINNPDILMNDLIINLINKVISPTTNEKDYAEKMFDYFRTYFEELQKYKYSIYEKAGVNKFNIYDLDMEISDKVKVNDLVNTSI